MKLSYSDSASLRDDASTSFQRLQQSITDILEQPYITFDNTVGALSLALAREQNTIDFMSRVSNISEVRDASRDAAEAMSNFKCDLFANEKLYRRLQVINLSGDIVESCSMVEKRLLDRCKKRFEHSGVTSPECVTLLKEISRLGIEFSKNSAEDLTTLRFSTDQLTGVPIDFLERTRKDDETHCVTMSTPDVNTILTYCSVKETRAKVKFTRENRCLANEALLEAMIKKRNQVAHLLGYISWADYVKEGNMLKSANETIALLESLSEPLKKSANQYLERIGGPSDLADIAFYGNNYLMQHYQIDSQLVRQYFPVPIIFKNMLEIYSQLFSMHFEIVPNPSDIWDNSVITINVFDKTEESKGNAMGTMYCDLYPRSGKFERAAVFSLREGYADQDNDQVLPVAGLVCNFDFLMSVDDVETLFHEFGHAIHMLCCGYRNRYFDFGLNGIATDFLETPSQIIEQWLQSPLILKRISSHHQTGESIPDPLLDQIIKSKRTGRDAYEWNRQCAMSYFDTLTYTEWKSEESSLAQYSDSIMKKLCPIVPQHPNFINIWGHLANNHYAGSYYSYVNSIVLACDLYSVFEASGDILNPELGMRYRKIILEPGDTLDSAVLVEQFLGRKPNSTAFINRMTI